MEASTWVEEKHADVTCCPTSSSNTSVVVASAAARASGR
jgi:hypothetical protein